MKRNQLDHFIFSPVTALLFLIWLAVGGCTPDVDTVEVTPRATIVGSTAVPSPISTSSPTAHTPTSVFILSNPAPLLPGMVYWGPDGNSTWLVNANRQPQKISELSIIPRFLTDSSKFVYYDNDNIWAVEKYGENRRILASTLTHNIWNWDIWSEEKGVIWLYDKTGADWEIGELGKIKGIDWGGLEIQVTDKFSYGFPAGSPDGKTLAFDEEGQPVLFHLENGKQPLDLAEFGLSSELKFVLPAWSPDQKLLAWAAYRSVASERKYSVVIFNLETKMAEVIELDHWTNEFIHELDWRPNTSELAFVRGGHSTDTPDYQSWIVNGESGEKVLIAPASHIQWSPDGEWLFYYQDYRQGEEEGWWITTPDGRERHHLIAGSDPLWSPDGRFLLYCTERGPWLTSPENNWVPVAINFGFPARCDAMQWLPIDEPEIVAYVLPTVLPSPTPTTTPAPTKTPIQPTPTATSAAVAACRINPHSSISTSDPIQNAILFVSKSNNQLGVLASIPQVDGQSQTSQLWAISADGKEVNRLTADDHGIGWHVSETTPAEVLLMSNTDLPLNGTSLQQIPLPVVCDSRPVDNPDYMNPCGDFKISADGKWAAFSWGPEFYGGRGDFGLINLLTGQTQTSPAMTWLIRYLPDDQRVMGHSVGGNADASWVNSITGESRHLGTLGAANGMVWNKAETAFAVEVENFIGTNGAVWGYNVETANLFLPEPQPWAADQRPIWTIDGTHLLYQHHAITQTDTYTLTYGAGQIQLVDAVSGEKRILAADPRYHYQLCPTREADSCRWAEDWIQVRRYPYQPDPFYFEENQDSGFQCTWYGQGCLGPVENLGLNWRTGEIIPWEAVAELVPIPEPTAVPPSGPNLATTPIYANTEIGYALYMGNDGRSLWCVSEDGNPQKWVEDAEWFMYVP